MDFRSR